jgi:Holliday junction resolvase RusA-like endonuclease
MSSPATLSLDEQAAALLRMGVPESRIRATLGFPATAAEPSAAAPTVALPVTLVVPWTLLVSDDERFGKPQAKRTKDGRIVVQNVLSRRYREAKSKLRADFREQIGGGRLPYTDPVHVSYLFYWPDRRRHDASNHLKLLNDVLSKLVVADDCQIESFSGRTAIDPDRPRCAVDVRPLNPTR